MKVVFSQAFRAEKYSPDKNDKSFFPSINTTIKFIEQVQITLFTLH